MLGVEALNLLHACAGILGEVEDVHGAIDTIRDDIERYCSSCSLFDAMKVVFIDECEYLSQNPQGAMRGTIERHSTVPFLLTANDTSKLHHAIKSRCLEVCFDVGLFEAAEVIERLLPRYHAKVINLGCEVTFQRLREIMYLKFSDLRAVANALEFEVGITS